MTKTSSGLPSSSPTSEASVQLLANFESLHAREQHELFVAMLKLTGDLTDTELSAAQLVSVADDLFQAMDEEEDNVDDTIQG